MKKTSDLVARIEALGEDLAKEQKQQVPASAKVIQLPLWAEPVRAVPNGFLRSALFGAIAKGRRRYIDGEEIAAVDGVTIRYTGARLDQGDLDVWESVLHAVRLQELGSRCRVTSYALLKLMGLSDTGKNRTTLHKRIKRLVANAVEVQQGRYCYIGGLINEAFKDEKTHVWVIELNPKLRPLFDADQFTQIEWAVRNDLAGKPLAQWLHGFYASHASPYPIKVETLHRLCGSESEVRRYRQTLGDALDAVVEACAAHGETFRHEIKDGLVYVEKQPSGPQQRHLVKQKGLPRKSRN